MCGGAIISDLVPPSRTSRRVNAADLLWNPRVKNEKTTPNNYYSKPLITDLDDDFEADFQGFKDDDILVKPLSFSPKGIFVFLLSLLHSFPMIIYCALCVYMILIH